MFTGSGVAVVTPFNKDGSVNYSALKGLVEFHLQNSTDAIIVCGTTGEASTLTDNEQLEVIRFVVEAVNKKIPVIAGTGSNHTEHGIELSKGAEKCGADGLLVVTPYYNKTTQKGLLAHYTDIAKNVNIPIIMYNIPPRTGLNMLPETMQKLCQIENIVGVKEASGNIGQVAKIAALCGESFNIYSGDDNMVLPMMALGGKGVISTAANIIPRDMHDMTAQYLSGNLKKALEIQLAILPLVDAIFCEVNPIPIKTALNLMGKNAGYYRKPLVEMEEKNLEHLKTAMKDYGLI